ncbi:pyridoxal phosphate-dependent aminotransferase [Rhodocaloribacter sp.]
MISKGVLERMETGSAIRKMFEEGLWMKAEHGAEHVADLSLGNPEFPPPKAFLEALRRVASEPIPHGYMPNAGYPHVREAVAGHLNRHGYFEGIEARHVIMTTGAAGAINVVLKTILDPGDEVIVLRPYFVEYRFYVDNHGGRMVLVDTNEDFSLDVDAVAAAVTRRTKAVLLNSPNNPSGRVYDRASLEALAEMLRRKERELGRPIALISDEPYRELLFDDTPFVSPATVYPNSFMCYSWSKSFSIAGERIGYVAVNPAAAWEDDDTLLGALAMTNRALGFVNAPALMQRAVAEAVEAEVETGHYAGKRAKLCAALDEGGYAYVKPEGTFYIFPETLGPEDDFIRRAKRHLLLVVPGSAFGRPGHFRLSFACDDRTVERACEKLRAVAEDFYREQAQAEPVPRGAFAHEAPASGAGDEASRS